MFYQLKYLYLCGVGSDDRAPRTSLIEFGGGGSGMLHSARNKLTTRHCCNKRGALRAGTLFAVSIYRFKGFRVILSWFDGFCVCVTEVN